MSVRSNRRERGSQTRRDPYRYIVLWVIGGTLGLIVLLGLTALAINLWFPLTALRLTGGSPRAVEEIPRSIDIWIVYPDETLRFVTLFYPLDDPTLPASQPVKVAGPLMNDTIDIKNSEVLGGFLSNSEFLPGPGRDSNLIYEQFTLTREPDSSPYGVDVTIHNAPYLVRSGETEWTIALGVSPQTYYRQVIVAVVFPAGTRIAGAPDMFPYRYARLGDWAVFYFDTTIVGQDDAIRINYKALQGDVPEPIDYWQIDAMR